MMRTLGELLEQTLAAAHERDWAAYRTRFSALRAALGEPADGEVRARLDMLQAAAPEHDPAGCVAELEQLRAAIDAAMPCADGDAPQAAIDLRGLKPPEPIVRILDALERSPREPLRVLLPHEPVPLYALLHERGFACSGVQRDDGSYELLIQPA